MLIRWSPAAAEDLEQLFKFIRLDNPDAAQRTLRSILERAGALVNYPSQGRKGRVPGTRELPLPPLPFIVVYRILEQRDVVEIVNVIHGAQRWPPAD